MARKPQRKKWGNQEEKVEKSDPGDCKDHAPKNWVAL